MLSLDSQIIERQPTRVSYLIQPGRVQVVEKVLPPLFGGHAALAAAAGDGSGRGDGCGLVLGIQLRVRA